MLHFNANQVRRTKHTLFPFTIWLRAPNSAKISLLSRPPISVHWSVAHKSRIVSFVPEHSHAVKDRATRPAARLDRSVLSHKQLRQLPEDALCLWHADRRKAP